ncbi:hypothetical protein [Companilactobacillus paralimentarius]|uniref:hypothetical protein n=1 Tax=Companilactobacillus paralimentarius TaxID=83526 RepID=UPI0038501810
MKVSFGKRINYIPLLICLASSIIIGYAIFLMFNNVSISLLLGILSLIVMIMICTLNLTKTYGYWEISKQGIKYSDLVSTGQKVAAILVPRKTKESFINYSKVKAVQLVATTGIKAPSMVKESGALFAYSPDTVLDRFPSDYYLTVKLKDGYEINLDLSSSVSDTSDIAEMIEIVEKETHQDVALVRQEK